VTPVRGCIWIVAVGVTGVTLSFVINLQSQTRAVYVCSRADRAPPGPWARRAGDPRGAIDQRMRDQLLVLIIAAVIILLLAFAANLLLNEWLHAGAEPLGTVATLQDHTEVRALAVRAACAATTQCYYVPVVSNAE
jgi:hypothetical protein